MKLQEQHYSFTLLTPAMLGGALGKEGNAEMRIASIRGQVRWWHRTATLAPACNQVWGQTDGTIIASRVSLTLAPHLPAGHTDAEILPHKRSAYRDRDAIDADQTYTLLLRRLVGCAPDHWKTAQNAIKLWLLLGGLGLRSNRAAGSVWPLDPPDEPWVPQNEAALKTALAALDYHKPVQLADSTIATQPNDLRRAASDTVNGSPQYFGDIKPTRKPSPLKMKVIRLGSDYRLLLTGLKTSADFSGARNALGLGKPLGNASWHQL